MPEAGGERVLANQPRGVFAGVAGCGIASLGNVSHRKPFGIAGARNQAACRGHIAHEKSKAHSGHPATKGWCGSL